MSSQPAHRAPRVVVAVLAVVLAIVGLLAPMAAAAPGPQVFNLGTAPFLGDLRNQTINAPIVDLARTPSGNGYWELGSDGGVYTYGDAQFFGSTGSFRLNRPIVAMAPTPSGLGYYFLTGDGGLFTFGDASFYGSGVAGPGAPTRTFVDIVVDPAHGGYALLAEDGELVPFGPAAYPHVPVGPHPFGVVAVAVASTPTGEGAWVVYSDGTIDATGDAADFGDGPAGVAVADMAAAPDGSGLWLVTPAGRVEAIGGVTRGDDVSSSSPINAIVAHSADGYWVATGGPGPGAITGRVVDDLGQPAAGLCVSLNGFPNRTTTTDADGRFRFTVPTGTWRVRFGCFNDDRYVGEWFEDAQSEFAARGITVGNDEVVDIGEAVVDRGAVIAGVVSKPDATPLPGACALAIARDGAFGGQVQTTVTGYYRLTGLRAATYDVSFNDCTNDEYLGEYYDDAPTRELATPVAVTVGQTKGGIDASLTKAGSISGTVATADGGQLGQVDACVTASNDEGVFKQVPILTGAYRVKGLPSGAYKVHFNDCMFGQASFGGPNDYLDEWWQDQPTAETATPVTATVGADTSGIDAVLDRASSIEGTVTAASTAAPLPFNCVAAVQGKTVVRSGSTSNTGYYQIRGLRPGSYEVKFCGGGIYSPEWWNDAPDQESSTPVTVGPSERRTGVDAALEPSGELTGQVTDADGNPVVACVAASDGVGTMFAGLSNWGGVTGNYRINGLSTDRYTLRFQDCSAPQSSSPAARFATEWFEDAAMERDATSVQATRGASTVAPTARLDRESVISGVVTNDEGAPLSNVCVRAYLPDGTDASISTAATTVTGYYRIRQLPAATYSVSFEAYCRGYDYLSEWWNDAPTRDASTPVQTSVGTSTDGIDAVLARNPSTPRPSVPEAPTTVDATAGEGSAFVTWSRVAGTHGPITGYRVVASPGGATQTFGPDAERSASFSGLTPGTSYTFTVQASTATGYGAGTVSNAVVPTGAPDAPAKPTVVAGDGTVTVSWSAPAANGSPITEYVVTATSDGATRQVAGDVTTVVFDGRTNGAASTYSVTAVNAVGPSAPSPASDSISSAGVPAAPGKPTATRGDGSVGLSWAPSDPNGRVVSSYVITASSDGAQQTVAGDTTSATFAPRTNGVGDTFTVVAINAMGTSASSPGSDVVVPAGVPTAPGKPTVTAGDGSIALTWAPSSPNGSALTEYVVTASSDGAQLHVAADRTSATFTGRTNGVASTYAVTAVNAVGSSAASPASDSISSAGVPFAPGKPTATSRDRAVDLTWAAADGNGRAVEQYVVKASSDGAEMTVAGDTTSATFAGRTNGVPDTFTVTAVNAVGTGATSPASNLVIPAAIPGAPGKPIVVPGNGSVALTWTPAVANGSAIVEYVVTASSDGAELHVAAGLTTANFGGRTNGVSSTYTVKAVNGVGTGPASPPSESVASSAPPLPPTTPNPIDLVAGSSSTAPVPQGAEVVFTGSGFKPYAPGDVVINSTPRKLGSFVTDAAGSFTVVVTIPEGFELGNHTLVATAKGPDGTMRTLSTPVVVTSSAPATGYRLLASDGGIFAFGRSPFAGSAGGSTFTKPFAAGATTPSGKGYWLVGSDGIVLTFGDANFHGSLAGTKLNQPIVGMAATPTGKGYWLVATDGGIFAFGDAAFQGSTGDLRLNKPIVGMASTPSGKGYWLVASDGGIFAFGDAVFQGSTGDLRLNKPIVGLAPSPTGRGYWLVASDGGIFSFGDTAFHGSTGDVRLNQPIVAMQAMPTGKGYRLVAADGGIFTFGDATFLGSTGDLRLAKPILAIV